jgi:hypothetical protein
MVAAAWTAVDENRILEILRFENKQLLDGVSIATRPPRGRLSKGQFLILAHSD